MVHYVSDAVYLYLFMQLRGDMINQETKSAIRQSLNIKVIIPSISLGVKS